MSVISEKAIEKGLELLSTATKVATDSGPKLLEEYLNLVLFETVLELFPTIFSIIVALALTKMFKLITGAHEEQIKDLIVDIKLEELNLNSHDSPVCGVSSCGVCERLNHNVISKKEELKTSKNSLNITRFVRNLVLFALGWYTLVNNTLPQVKMAGSIWIAPKVFLLKHGAEWIKK